MKVTSLAVGVLLVVSFGLIAVGCDRPSTQMSDRFDGLMVNVNQETNKHEHAANQAEHQVDDATITAMVRGKLLALEEIRPLDISVNTDAGVVSLNGAVQSARARENAARLALAVDGVKAVNNDLEIR